ncbi:Predicted peptidyl-tRNA hydrolase [Ceraceosorus bombacis]|uniref:Predicted peptidyl-tRNA hydrolase n=1 Tax=Ceraceosorus bombacis TaxID=401625 RepID=A0A0P1B8T0_9BASI|nr:Predicted peptidyl-tRNA hydrolase [Ceraceosorus bombacis]
MRKTATLLGSLASGKAASQPFGRTLASTQRGAKCLARLAPPVSNRPFYPTPNPSSIPGLLRNLRANKRPQARFLSSSPGSAVADESAADIKARAAWIAEFRDKELPKDFLTTTFTRASGPGGQNVNKLSTKANIRLDLNKLKQGVHGFEPPPSAVIKLLARRSPFYVASSHSLLVTSSQERSQASNEQDALRKLHAHLVETLSADIPGETSDQQKERVKRLQESDARRKKMAKQKRGDVKSGRKSGKAVVWD